MVLFDRVPVLKITGWLNIAHIVWKKGYTSIELSDAKALNVTALGTTQQDTGFAGKTNTKQWGNKLTKAGLSGSGCAAANILSCSFKYFYLAEECFRTKKELN